MADLHVAQTILQQLGGQRFLVMTGAKNLIGSADSLTLRINSVNYDGKRVNVVKVTLDPLDTYTVTASYLRAGKLKTVATVSDVYNDALQAVFTRVTGLHTSLGIPAAEARKFDNKHED
jgi:hypothetical protein